MTTISNYIRDQALARIIAAKIAPWKTTRVSPQPTLQTGDVPALGAYLIRETMNPDGDANVGVPRFIVDAVISFMVIDIATKPSVLEGSIDAIVDQIETTLLCDPTFVSLKDVGGNFLIDSIQQITRTYQFPNNGEAYYIECRLQMTFRFFVVFEPLTPNDLLKIDVTTQPMTDKVITGNDVLEIELPSATSSPQID